MSALDRAAALEDEREDEDIEDPQLSTQLRRSNRVASLTSAGRQYQESLARSSCTRFSKQLTRQEDVIRELLQESADQDRIDHETLKYDKIMVSLSAALKKLISLVEDDNERSTISRLLEELRHDVSTFKEEIFAVSSDSECPREDLSMSVSTRSKGLGGVMPGTGSGIPTDPQFDRRFSVPDSEIGSGTTVIERSSQSAPSQSVVTIPLLQHLFLRAGSPGEPQLSAVAI